MAWFRTRDYKLNWLQITKNTAFRVGKFIFYLFHILSNRIFSMFSDQIPDFLLLLITTFLLFFPSNLFTLYEQFGWEFLDTHTSNIRTQTSDAISLIKSVLPTTFGHFSVYLTQFHFPSFPPDSCSIRVNLTLLTSNFPPSSPTNQLPNRHFAGIALGMPPILRLCCAKQNEKVLRWQQRFPRIWWQMRNETFCEWYIVWFFYEIELIPSYDNAGGGRNHSITLSIVVLYISVLLGGSLEIHKMPQMNNLDGWHLLAAIGPFTWQWQLYRLKCQMHWHRYCWYRCTKYTLHIQTKLNQYVDISAFGS